MLRCKARQRRKAERPLEILEAAFEEFAVNGFAGTRLDDVAARAGVTKGTIYVYFPSKEELFVATLKNLISPALDHLETLMTPPQHSAADILRDHLLFVADLMMSDRRKREVIRMLMADGPRFPALVDRWHADVMEPCCAAFGKVIAHGVARGEFRASAASDHALTVLAPIIMANVWLSVFGDRHPLDLRQFFAASIETLVHGLTIQAREGNG